MLLGIPLFIMSLEEMQLLIIRLLKVIKDLSGSREAQALNLGHPTRTRNCSLANKQFKSFLDLFVGRYGNDSNDKIEEDPWSKQLHHALPQPLAQSKTI